MGIGIGSSLEEIKQAYGEPDGMFGSSSVIYTYCFGTEYLNLGVQGDTVFVMNLGYYVPMPEDAMEYCE